MWPVINREQKKIIQIHGSTRVQDHVDVTRSHHLDVSLSCKPSPQWLCGSRNYLYGGRNKNQ